MSLIFKALQRSRQQNPNASAAETKPSDRKNLVTWRNVLLSPSVALLAGVSIFLFGVFTTQLVKSVSSRTTPLTPQVEAATSPTYSVSEPEETIGSPVVSETEPSPPIVDSADPGQTTPKTGSQFQFFPAESATTGESPSPLPADSPGHANGDRIVAVYQPGFDTRVDDASAGADEAPRAMAVGSQDPGMAAFAGATGGPAETPRNDPRPIPKISTGKAFGNEPDPAYNRQAEHAKHHITATRLADRLLGAIALGDEARSAELLNQLAKIKGEDHPFVQKLAAYAHIRHGNLEAARGLLVMVLANQPDDLEAGLNMAVVDIRGGRHDQARQSVGGLAGSIS